MRTVNTINEVRDIIRDARKNGLTVGLVPTMGALHEGHMSLIKESRKQCGFTVVTVFVNPLQFGPSEDLDKYPRTLQKDCELSDASGADLVFAPSAAEMIGTKPLLTYVDVNELSDNLCGASRPGHFRGVCTIVSKFFNIIMPDRAYFGKKDIQQLTIIKRMTNELNFDIKIVPCPIIREKDGLAMSSRNVYLSEDERRSALILNKAIKNAVSLVDSGENTAKKVINTVSNIIGTVKSAKIDYVKIVDENMKDVKIINKGDILALAVFIGKTRLIDNHIIGEKVWF